MEDGFHKVLHSGQRGFASGAEAMCLQRTGATCELAIENKKNKKRGFFGKKFDHFWKFKELDQSKIEWARRLE